MKKQALALALSVFAAGAYAGDDLNYSFLEGHYAKGDMDLFDTNFEPDGYGFTGSFEFLPQFFVQADYMKYEGTARVNIGHFTGRVNGELETAAVAVGFHTPIAQKTDFVAKAGYAWDDVSVKVEQVRESTDDKTLFVSGGLRSRINSLLEVGASLTWYDYDDSETVKEAYVQAHLTDSIGLGVSFAKGDDADLTKVYARFSF